MIDTHSLFSNPPTSIGDVLGLVFSIFFAHWKTFALMSALYYVAIIVTSIVLVMFSYIVFAETIMKIASNIPMGAMNGGGAGNYYRHGRHLLDYVLNTSGASRALEGYYPDAAVGAGILAIGFELILMYLLFVAVLTLVISVFVGAFNHVVAEVYTGGSPSVSRSLAYGWGQKWKVYIFQLILSLAVLGILLVDIGIPAAAGHGVVLGFIVALGMLVALSTLLLGAVPSIVVENKSPIDAFKRSYNLCKDYFCFIFCNQFTFNALSFVFMIAINMLLDKAPAVISLLVHFLINIVLVSIGPCLVMVLYMSIRIRSEQLTGQELSDELSNIVPIANAVEMRDDYQDRKSVV